MYPEFSNSATSSSASQKYNSSVFATADRHAGGSNENGDTLQWSFGDAAIWGRSKQSDEKIVTTTKCIVVRMKADIYRGLYNKHLDDKLVKPIEKEKIKKKEELVQRLYTKKNTGKDNIQNEESRFTSESIRTMSAPQSQSPLRHAEVAEIAGNAGDVSDAGNDAGDAGDAGGVERNNGEEEETERFTTKCLQLKFGLTHQLTQTVIPNFNCFTIFCTVQLHRRQLFLFISFQQHTANSFEFTHHNFNFSTFFR